MKVYREKAEYVYGQHVNATYRGTQVFQLAFATAVAIQTICETDTNHEIILTTLTAFRVGFVSFRGSYRPKR
ncbi:MAG: hypothetical protein ACRD9S_21410 [Pyrinomonadaceae bacterium]